MELLKNKIFKQLSVILLTILILILFLPKLFVNINTTLFYNDKDALKNYYTYQYYIVNNNSYTNFEGMNYPYGEDVIYTDGQIPIALFLKIFGVSNYAIGIMNSLILISIILSALLFYNILKYLKINYLFAFIGSISIIFLSPQIVRLYGHFSLSYIIFYPLTIYYLINETKPNLSNIIIFTTNLISFFFHPYIGLSIFLFTITTHLLRLFIKQNNNKQIIISILIQSILPVIIFSITNYLLDTHINRSNTPTGLYDYHSTLSSIFLPLNNVYNYFLNIQLPYEIQKVEARAYIGLVGNLTIITLLFLTLYKVIKTKTISINNNIVLIISSFLLLLFAFGFPHVYVFPKLLDIFTFLRQFRALGRFAWFFYYVIGITSIFFIHKIFLKDKIFLKIISIFLLFLFFTEALSYVIYEKQYLAKYNNIFIDFKNNKYSKIKSKINNIDYQAIIPLPFFHVGSEDYYIQGSLESKKNTMLLSYHLNIPYIGVMGSRSSITETKKTMSILSPQYYYKQIKKDLKNKKDFLIVVSNDKLDELEQDLLNKSKYLFNQDNISFYTLPYDSLFQYKTYKEKIINNYNLYKDSIKDDHNYVFNKSNTHYVYINYNDLNTPKSHNGSGAYRIDNDDYAIVFKLKEAFLNKDKTYTISFWMYNGINGITDKIVAWEECNTITKECKWLCVANVKESKIIDNEWSFIEFKFSPPNNNTSYTLFFPANKHKNNAAKYTYLDDLLIKEVGFDIYQKDNDTLLYNTHKIITEVIK